MPPRFRRVSVLFFTICALLAVESPRIVAQAPPSSPRTTPSKDPRGDAAYVIEQQYNRVRFETNGAARRELNVRVKVIDEAALRAWGQLPLTYDSASEELTLARVDVQKPDGSIVSAAAGAIQDFAVRPFPQLPIFLDLHQKLATISALRPGDVLVINAVWTSTHPIIPGQFSFQYTFNTHEVVCDERLEIDVPAAKPVIVRTLSGAPAEEHGGDGVMAADRRVYRWKTANTALRKDEPNGDDDEEAPPADVRVTTFRTWDEVGRWFSELLSKTPDASVRAKAAELTKGLADDKAKTEAIYAYVSTQIRYVSLSFGLGRYAPHAPAEVLANQYGDCKDKATLLAALLAAAGVESAPVLVNSRRSASEDVPSPLEFDHMIAVVPRGPDAQWVWLDATTEVAPAGMLGGNVRARKGLFVGDARHSARLVTTPADPPFPSIDRIDVEGTVDALGVLHARVTQTMRGDSELAVRLILRTLPRDQWEAFAKGFAQALQLEGDVTDIEAGDPADTRQPMQFSFALRRGGYLDWAAASSEVSPLMPTIPLPPLSEDDVKRRDHLTLRSPATVRAHVVIELPQGYAADPPVPVKIAQAGLEYESAYRTEGTRVIADREIRWNARRVAAADFGAYATFVRAVEADLKQHVKVRGTASGAIPAVPADATAGEVYASERSIVLVDVGPMGTADFDVIVGADGRATEARFESGLEELRSFEAKLRALSYPVEVPGGAPVRLLLRAHVMCGSKPPCGAGIMPAFRGNEDR
jgi:hypothetical protein